MSGYKINEEIGKKIQIYRRKRQMSQEELAEKVGIHRNHVGRIERGETNMPIYTLYKIVKALKIGSSDLLPF